MQLALFGQQDFYMLHFGTEIMKTVKEPSASRLWQRSACGRVGETSPVLLRWVEALPCVPNAS